MTEYVKDVPEKPEVLIGFVFTFMQTVSLAKTFDSVFENARTRLLRQKIWYQSHALMWRRALGQFHFLCDFSRLTACLKNQIGEVPHLRWLFARTLEFCGKRSGKKFLYHCCVLDATKVKRELQVDDDNDLSFPSTRKAS